MENKNVYEIITEKVIEQLNNGVKPWSKPWVGGGNYVVSRITGKPYSFINKLLLSEPGEYLTFAQVNKLGGKVKSGEKAHFVCFWKLFKNETTDENGEKVTKTIPMLRYYNVFNINQCEGIEPKYIKEQQTVTEIESSEIAENLISNYKTRENIIINDIDVSGKAFYSPADDSITVPCKKQFTKQSEYYSTVFHECIHSTGHKSRLNRLDSNGNSHYGSDKYSKEELIAEIGACALNNFCGINDKSSDDNSIAYLAGWAEALKENPRLIVTAASRAEKAVEYFKNGKQTSAETESE